LLETEESAILVDAGLSARELERRIKIAGNAPENLDALLVTHEHNDHSSGVGPLVRRFSLPLYMNDGTRRSLSRLGRIDRFHEFETGDNFEIRDMRISAVSQTHDAVDPVGFVVETAAGKVGVATDLGVATRLVRDRLKGCRVLVLEANHDEEMLRDGPYPPHLKQRIRSTHGHLSNAACADLLSDLLWEGLETVFLAHLSEVNNDPDLALSSILCVLENQNVCRPKLVVGTQEFPSQCVSFL